MTSKGAVFFELARRLAKARRPPKLIGTEAPKTPQKHKGDGGIIRAVTLGVRVLSVTEGVGDSSESVLLEAILEAMAEEYSRQLAQNVRRGMRQNAEKGLSLGGLAPLGYRRPSRRGVSRNLVDLPRTLCGQSRPSRRGVSRNNTFTQNIFILFVSPDRKSVV